MLLLLVVPVCLVNQSIKCVIHVSVFDCFPNFLYHVYEFLSYHVVNTKGQYRHCLVCLTKASIFYFYLCLKNLCLFFVSSDFFHKVVLTINEFKSFF